ncbi:hypothetical protein SLA2020_268160 [Shorea laevis]
MTLEASRIVEGQFHQAEIHRPHAVIAVKKIWRSGSDVENSDDLLREVNLLGRLRHHLPVRFGGTHPLNHINQ